MLYTNPNRREQLKWIIGVMEKTESANLHALEKDELMKTFVGRWARFLAVWPSVFIMVGFCLPAMAALGGDASSVETDRAQMKASIKTTPAEAYSVQEIQVPGGTKIEEYVSPAGRVFAVAWHGPFFPDMQQILGAYFQPYIAALQAQPKHYGRRPLNIQQPGLVVQTGGHIRAYWGRAYVPGMLPQGVNADEIK
jgi:hypothetical protein